MVYFHCERVFSKILSYFVKLQFEMYGLDLVCTRILMIVSKSLPDNFDCSDNFPPYVIEILMKYSLFFL